MKFKKALLSICIFLQISTVAFSRTENLESIGIITKEIINSEVYDPNYSGFKNLDLETDLTLYSEPGIISGKRILQQWELREKIALLATRIIDENGNKKRPEIKKSSLVWTAYKSLCFQYLEAKDGYLKIKLNNVFYWLNQNEIEQQNFKPILWFDYLTNLNSELLKANVNLNLRAEPSKQSEKIKLLVSYEFKGESHYMKMTGKTNGQWAEVEVRIYNSYCDNKQLIRTVIGWIKVIDDSGIPNIFDVPSPCG